MEEAIGRKLVVGSRTESFGKVSVDGEVGRVKVRVLVGSLCERGAAAEVVGGRGRWVRLLGGGRGACDGGARRHVGEVARMAATFCARHDDGCVGHDAELGSSDKRVECWRSELCLRELPWLRGAERVSMASASSAHGMRRNRARCKLCSSGPGSACKRGRGKQMKSSVFPA